jgi:Holliday junction DNA helicase RuvA
MIGFLQGKILDTDGKKAILLTEGGIGYEINYGYFLEANCATAIFIHHHISENDQSLWGFQSLVDKKMFELLKTVNKVGSSKAYPLISTIGTESVIQAIMFDQPNVLSQAPGIGKKMAEQIILSLRDKVEKFRAANIQVSSEPVSDIEILSNEKGNDKSIDLNAMNDALRARDSLGYRDKEVASLVRQQVSTGTTGTEDIIKNVLREL